MKKFYFLISFVIISISCSSDSSEVTVNPNLLQRVDFYPGTSMETRWFFNSDGLLYEITKADGTIVQTFTYDSDNRLAGYTVFNADATSSTHTFSYDSDDSVISIDGESLNYDSSLNAYIFGDLTNYYTSITINIDKLLTYTKTVWVDYDWDGTPVEIINSELGIQYSDNNMVSYFPNESCNYFTYDNKTNPLRNATLAICKAFSFSTTMPWPDNNCISANNVLTHDYCSEDPESEVFHYTFNANDLPLTQTRDNYYLGTYENTTTSINYYYQGDALP
ncbi:hypothetical protein [Flavobacterium sangjuense]|uniref:DUF4595 domain-containing protein n=1 Tax=Flavobacterium sangjuense TaxID=2518177 RepID=A0A4V1CBP4_9FLAO|nr:hypothetical protein [Flavobacterium sangjuense]QBZ96694.1 hypothetical protein GS03_00172 [Flavobacterium sangjuense]